MGFWSKLLRRTPLVKKEEVLVRFYRDRDFRKEIAYDGVYYGTWSYPGFHEGNFPLKLVEGGKGLILMEGLAGTGKPYPGFEWKKA